MKAAFKVFMHGENPKPRLGVNHGILQGVHVVAWPNMETHLPTHIAYEARSTVDDNTGEPVYRQVWGTEASEPGRNIVGGVFRWLKPAIYGDEGTQAKHKRRIESQIDKLPEAIRFIGRNVDDSETQRKLTCLDLYSDFIGHAWRHILRRIKQTYPQLPWPRWAHQNLSGDFRLPEYPAVEVVMPLPANSRPHHVDLAVQAARRAGIPIPFPVAEPAAAFAYDIQTFQWLE